jgi:aerobic C4-dicarboxylate transport protein
MPYLREEILICFATASSEVVLPRLLLKMENLGCSASVVGLVVPTGYSFNLTGTCLYLATTAVFLAQATNTPLAVGQQIGLLLVLLLTSKGSAGVSGAAFVVLAATLSTAGTIPVASVALILGVHRLLAEGMVPTNLVGNAIATIIVAKSEGALDEERLNAVLDGRLGTLSTEDATAVTRVCNPLSADGLRLALRAAIRVRCTNQDCSSVRQM